MSMSEKNMKTYLTIAQVAELTQTSAATVRRWIARGELRAYRFGVRNIRIDLADLDKMRKQVNPAGFDYVAFKAGVKAPGGNDE